MSKKLYHYTSAAGLVNILNTGYLRATHAWQLDDGSECRHAINTLKSVTPEISACELWQSIETTLLSQPRFVVCFSRMRNDIYQWEKYADHGSGVCIVFDPEVAKRKLLSSGWDQFDCHYNQYEQKVQLEKFAEDIQNPDEIARLASINELWKWNIQFKREKFSKENEIRYVFTTHKTAEKTSTNIAGSAVAQELIQFDRVLNFYPHTSGMFDEKFRLFEPFIIQGAISEIILGSSFTATNNYRKFLNDNYVVNQS